MLHTVTFKLLSNKVGSSANNIPVNLLTCIKHDVFTGQYSEASVLTA